MGEEQTERIKEFNEVYPTKRSFWADSTILLSWRHGVCVFAVIIGGFILFALEHS